VKTSLEGNALVCVEREGILRRYTKEIRKDNPVIEIPVQARRFAGFVNTLLRLDGDIVVIARLP
ncbi:hypothetical protein, partial [Akkermansia muciniphila]|uniref:hypothetical protein n=1 Tax=Akkermansia muciniphila TaxID=239935 RepID=UPI00164BBDA2